MSNFFVKMINVSINFVCAETNIVDVDHRANKHLKKPTLPAGIKLFQLAILVTLISKTMAWRSVGASNADLIRQLTGLLE